MKQTSLRFDDELAGWYEDKFKNLANGLTVAVKEFAKAAEIVGGSGEEIVNRLKELEAITRIATREITGVFTVEELYSIIDALNGTMITPEILFVPGWLVMEMQDAEALDGCCTMHGADVKLLIDKLTKFSQVQTYALYRLIKNFWDSPDETRNLERFVQQYAKKG